MTKYWIYTLIAGLLEIVWVSGFKYAHDFWTWAGTALTLLLSFFLIMECLKKLPVGTLYAVFTGIGTAGTVVTEMVFFHEPVRIGKLILIAILLAGVLGLKALSGEKQGGEA
ncbi:small multidrug resistance protein [Fictibacillus macauensis ZFHKF-1]|uniref:Small multidrug resistance protein n=1 Tax=Fictibacillus macauensis ZFHKF-1 TaxID=1196324 RepID=I8AET6_9BACL|nr:multidrug efflux SMR transporter [Fictibacillus macauensis]EIT84107.1 small multidrug resistance protein [Fictibacillus macauensis ZFHKF-1]